QRQVQRKGAAAARDAAETNLTAQQMRQLAADGQSQARATVLAGGSGVSLLECLKDDALFLWRDADAGVADREFDHDRNLRQGRMIRRPAAVCDAHPQPYATVLGELEGVGEQVLEHLQQPF